MTTTRVSIAELVRKGALVVGDGYRTKRSEHGRPGYRILRVADVLESRISTAGADFVSREFTRQIGNKLSQAGDVVLTTKGTVGRVARIPEGIQPLVYSPQVCFFRVHDESVLSPRYLEFWFRSNDFKRQASHRANNTDMAAYINLADIHSLTFELPSIDKQQAIAEVLGALDDKIAANARISEGAEALMAAKYEASLDSDAQQVRLGEVAEFHNRKRIPLSARQREDRLGSVPYYGATGIFGYVDEALFDERLVLVGEDGSVVQPDGRPVVQYIWGPAWVNNHAHVLTGVGLSTEVLRLAVERSYVVPIVTGAVQPKISMGNLKSLAVEIPAPERLQELEAGVDALCAVLRAKAEESRTLMTMRDALLPQLMSGKIRVRDAERVVEGVV